MRVQRTIRRWVNGVVYIIGVGACALGVLQVMVWGIELLPQLFSRLIDLIPL